MGDAADDTMNYEDEAGDHFTGDGGSHDQALEKYIRGSLKAKPQEISAGFNFQEHVLQVLTKLPNSDWREHRPLKCLEMFGCLEDSLDRTQRSELNFAEQKFSDLIDLVGGRSMECQTQVSNMAGCSWEESKFKRSEASHQCFGFVNGPALVVKTSEIREVTVDWIAKGWLSPNKSKRPGGGDYFTVGPQFLWKNCPSTTKLEDWR